MFFFADILTFGVLLCYKPGEFLHSYFFCLAFFTSIAKFDDWLESPRETLKMSFFVWFGFQCFFGVTFSLHEWVFILKSFLFRFSLLWISIAWRRGPIRDIDGAHFSGGVSIQCFNYAFYFFGFSDEIYRIGSVDDDRFKFRKTVSDDGEENWRFCRRNSRGYSFLFSCL